MDIDQKPVPGVNLPLSNGQATVSNADGAFEIKGLSPETYNLTLTATTAGYNNVVRTGYYVDNNVRTYPAGNL